MKKTILMAGCFGLALSLGAHEHLKSLNKEGISSQIPAKEDFYRHVNQKWMDENPLTPEYARYGQFNVLNDSSNNRVQRIVTGLGQKNAEPGSISYKIASIYQSGMDSVRRNSLGAKPIANHLSRIENAQPSDMEDIFLWIHKNFGSPLIGGGPQEDLHNSSEYAMYLGGAPLTLGDRDYYLAQDKDNKKIRDAYVRLIETQMQNAGYSKKDAKRIAKNVMKVETLIADSTWTREKSRDLTAIDNLMTIEEVKSLYPNLPLDRLFIETMGIETPATLYVTEPNTVKQGDNLMKILSDREKKDYYLWLTVDDAAPYLSDDFSNANFEFSKVMSGVQQQRPRWKRVQGTVESLLGEAVGELYVTEYFPESSKIYMEGLVENLRNALGKHIMHLPWMSDDTKVQAMKKLNAITVKIGYPDKWRDYSKLNIDASKSYWENIQEAILFNRDFSNADYAKPVDRDRWYMSPQTVNAYYSPSTNEICFPAGILQPPFFDPEATDAENYGAIGVVIGHEMTHGFDDQGRMYDKDGNLVNWWTDADAEAFTKLADGLVEQFNEVVVLGDTHANGRFTLGENIADQGGLRVAHTAFHNAGGNNGETVKGFTPDQLFYLAYANVWAGNIRDEEILNRTKTDPHSLGKWRVNATLRNIEPFFEAFSITEDQPMYRPERERIVIW